MKKAVLFMVFVLGMTAFAVRQFIWRLYKGNVKGAEAVDFDDSDWEAANQLELYQTLRYRSE